MTWGHDAGLVLRGSCSVSPAALGAPQHHPCTHEGGIGVGYSRSTYSLIPLGNEHEAEAGQRGLAGEKNKTRVLHAPRSAIGVSTHQHDRRDENHPHDRYQRPPSPLFSVVVVAGFGVLPVEAEDDQPSDDER